MIFFTITISLVKTLGTQNNSFTIDLLENEDLDGC